MKTKEEIIYELLISLNQGNCGYIDCRVDYAIRQYEQLIDKVIEDNAIEIKNTSGGNIDG
jgi:hypothetical protein